MQLTAVETPCALDVHGLPDCDAVALAVLGDELAHDGHDAWRKVWRHAARVQSACYWVPPGVSRLQ